MIGDEDDPVGNTGMFLAELANKDNYGSQNRLMKPLAGSTGDACLLFSRRVLGQEKEQVRMDSRFQGTPSIIHVKAQN